MSKLLLCLAVSLASLRLTLAAILAAGAIVLTGQWFDYPFGSVVAFPFAVLCLNLLAALCVTPKLRRQAGLLGFHLALAALALLVAADRLTFLNGHVEVTEGTVFDPRLVEAETGLFHRNALADVRFVQKGFEINYGPMVKRRDTVSTVLVPDGAGAWQPRAVGDDRPLVVGDYRFYTSFNKGFAPLLTYRDRQGVAHSGSLHLPSYPLNHFRQGTEWQLPDGSGAVKLWLHIPEPVYEEERTWQFRKPADARLVVMSADGRRELRPGEELLLGDGRLRYEELRSWMGYTIAYNPLTPWMLATVVIGIACFALHAVQKTFRLSWKVPGRKGALGHAK